MMLVHVFLSPLTLIFWWFNNICVSLCSPFIFHHLNLSTISIQQQSWPTLPPYWKYSLQYIHPILVSAACFPSFPVLMLGLWPDLLNVSSIFYLMSNQSWFSTDFALLHRYRFAQRPGNVRNPGTKSILFIVHDEWEAHFTLSSTAGWFVCLSAFLARIHFTLLQFW